MSPRTGTCFPPRTRLRAGATLIELLILMFVFTFSLLGALKGFSVGAAHGVLGSLAGVILGFLVGLLAGIGTLFAAASPFILAGMVRRAFQPAQMACTCGRGTGKRNAGREAEDLIRRIPGVPPAREWSRDSILERMREGRLDAARVALAAGLGHGASREIATGPAPQAPLSRDRGAGLPPDISAVLRSGLPPRLVQAWALGCAARALIALEDEFHEDRKARAIWEAACAALEDPGAAAGLEEPGWYFPTPASGCRVAHRPFWHRVLDRWTRGQHAGEAIAYIRAAALAYARPSGLWRTCCPRTMEDGYDNPQLRIDLAQPAYRAQGISASAARAAADPEAEAAWQRAFLADLVLGWESWDGDREAWRARVDGEWVPRVQRELTRARFDIPRYTEDLRKQLVPWDSLKGPRG